MPEGEGKLTAKEKDVIRLWIEAGAPGEVKAPPKTEGDLSITDEDRKFWAFQTPVRPKVPAIKTGNPIDAFVVDALQKRKLTLSAEAEPLVLLRRVTVDLTGLAATVAEVDGF